MDKATDGGRAFYQAIIGDKIRNANILVCCFALPRDKWVAKFMNQKDRTQFFNDGKTLNFKNADPCQFIDQVMWANIIMFCGGSTKSLMDILSRMPHWKDNLLGKTVVGSSAGAYILSSRYLVTDSVPQLAAGLGLLPVIIVAHYRSTFIADGDMDKAQAFWNKVDDLLRSNTDTGDMITLKEGQFQVIMQ